MLQARAPRRTVTRFAPARSALARQALALVSGATLLLAHAARAQVPSECASGAGSASGEVAGVIDPISLRLADDREVRLAGIEMPTVSRDDPAAIAARADLEALVRGRSVALVLAAPAPGLDRYGRLVAYAYAAAAPEAGFVQGHLLAGGHVLLAPVAMTAACRTRLRDAERMARVAKRGLWADPSHDVLQADHPADILARQGRFALVAGRILSVRESGGIVYVNFGRHWREDFTATILKRNERLFAGAGMAPNKLAGRRVEVRGWIEPRKGPAIEVTRPEQIEVVD
jgi:endonuclease YncB( thermonuclease family)